ncbi:MAG TPA: tandem-95 repeat protein [Chryseolinea sp.]|nr:tandem-95 repeat protein [Chryseolinea sp.]
MNDLPSLTAVANLSINQNTSTAALNFTVGDVETAPASLVMSASSDNITLVATGNIVFGGSGPNRNVTITPTPGLFGTATITLTVTDANAGIRQTGFVLTVLEVNAPPLFVTTITDQTIDEDIATGSLSFEVGDPNTPLTSLTVTGTSSNTGLVDGGGIAIGGSGANRSVTITPNINANGIANITLRVSDGTLFADMTFVLTVNSVNDLPTITSIATQNIDENTSTGLLGFTITDLETTAALLTMSSLSSNTSLADNAEIILGSSGGGSARSVNVFPKINRSGVATITLTVTDANGGTAQTAFLLNVAAVDAPPTISAISDFSINEDAPSLPIPFTVGDIDVPAEDLTVTSTSSATTVVASGGVTLVETGPGTWTVQITPVANAFGSSLITLTVNDGTETTTETFTVTVNAINDLPTITPIIPTQSINEDSNTGAINFAISDLETPAGSLTVTTSSSNATLVPPGNIVVVGSGGSRTITVIPVADGFGSADITIHVTDASSGETTQTFTVNVAPLNDTPTISAITTQNINEDQAGGTGDINFNVGDKEAGTLTVTASSSNQTVVPNGNITVAGSGTARTVNVVPANNAFGTAIITLTVTDVDDLFATSTFNVVVASINDVPTISTPPNQTIAENASTGAIPFIVGDIETAPGSLSVSRATSNVALVPLANVVLGGSGTNRTVTVSPLASQSGTSTITLTVTDGTTPVSTTFDVVVTAVEDPPTISAVGDLSVNEDNATAAIPFVITDPDTPVGTLSVTATSDNQSLAPDANVVLGGSGGSRSVTVTPLADQNGTATITITVTDGTNVANEVFVLTVTPVNDAPTLTAIANQTTNEDTPTGNIGFTVADLETAVAVLVVTATSDNATLVPNAPANLELGGTEASRTIRVIPAGNASGTANVTVTVDDGTSTATRTFGVTVSPINDAPIVSAIADQTVTEDAGTGAIAFTIGDEETPAGTLGVTVSSSNTTLVPVANVVLGGSGTDRNVTITPAFNQNGATTISITVDDGTTTTVRDFVVTVSPVNDAPTVSAISNRTINEDIPTGNISFTISDPETAASGLSVVAVSDNSTLVPIANILLGGTTGTRTINITPEANLSGSAVITISVSDGTNTTDRSFTLNVNPLNDLPVITGQETIAVNEGVAVTLDFVLLHVFDPDNDVSQLTLLPTGGANYSLTGPTTITPNATYYGPLTVPVLVSDGSGVGPLFNVAITIISTNDPPVITGQPAAITMDEDQTYTIPLSGFSITDPDSDPSLRTLTVLPGANYTVSNGNQITPSANVNGVLSVSVKVNDGQADSAPFNATVTVNPINDPPTITAQTTISTNEETELTINSGQFTIDDPEPVPYTIIVMPPAADAPYVLVSGSIIKPKVDVTGIITVPVRANDGQANSAVFDAQVNVVPVNDAPVITGQTSLSTVEDIPITVKLEDLVVTDVDNLTYPTGFNMTLLPGTDYAFTLTTITPSLDFVGVLQVNVQVNDGLASSNIYPLLITVTDDADAPVINGPKNLLSFDEDTGGTVILANLDWLDADTPEAEIVVDILPGTNYSFEDDRVIPSPNFFGTLTVNVRIFDGEAYSNTFPLQVTVNAVNDPASFNPIANISIFEDAPQQTFTVTGITAGPMETSQTMAFGLVSDNTALIPHPNPVPAYNGTAATAVVAFKPNLNESGVAAVTATLVDTPPGLSRTFTITVMPVNDPPTMNVLSDMTMDEGTQEQTVGLIGLSPGGGTPERDQTLKFIVSTDNDDLFEILPNAVDPTSGQTSAELHFKAKENAFGTARITVRLQDNGTPSPSPHRNFVDQSFTLTITPINDAPVIVSNPIIQAEPGKEYQYELIATDADNDDLTITATSLPAWLSLVQGTNGHATISGIPPLSAAGSTINLDISVTDEAGVSVPAGYSLTMNSRPILADFTLSIAEDNQLFITASDFAVGFDDPDGNSLAELQVLTLPEHGKLKTSAGDVSAGQKLTADQLSTLVYEPNKDFFGSDSFLWTGADGFGVYPEDESGALLTIQINGVNDPPVFTMEAETDTLKYELGSEERVRLTRQFDCSDPDGDMIKGAELVFSGIDGFQYRPENDFLIFPATPRISGSFNAGRLILTGDATHAEYDSAIRHIEYQYVDARELLLDTRAVNIQISDGVAKSTQQSRIIHLIYTFEDLEIPSAFSPNEGDEVNKTWAITSSKGEDLYADAEIKVYNKNGQLLFETRGLNDPWTGIHNGALLPTDTYYYTIDLHYNKVRYKGAVTLLR